MSANHSSNVLIVEHDTNLKLLIEAALKQEGFTVSLAIESNEALRLIQKRKPDCIVLDRMIPTMGGIRICRRVRMEPDSAEIPIIMINAGMNVSEKVLVLESGADDYLVRPFDIEELLAKIRAIERRFTNRNFHGLLKAGMIEMDTHRWTVTIKGIEVNLTIKEFKLLQELLQARGRVLSREKLLENIWGYSQDMVFNTRTVDVHIGRLRSKLGNAGDMIITVRNIGYRIDIIPEWIKHRIPAGY